MNLTAYETGPFYDELVLPDGQARPGAAPLLERVVSLPEGELVRRQKAGRARPAEPRHYVHRVLAMRPARNASFRSTSCPRIVGAADWAAIEQGLKQRIQALNLFIDDIYHAPAHHQGRHRAARAHPVGAQLPAAVRRAQPAAGHLVATSAASTWCATATVSSTCSKTTCAAPPACRTCWTNRQVLKRTFPQVFEASQVRPVDDISQPPAGHAAIPWRRRGCTIPRWWCSRPACTTRPISSTPSWRRRWAWSSSRAATWRWWTMPS